MEDIRERQARNFRFHLFEGMLMTASGAFLNSQTVYPALVQRLGGSNVAVGALPVLVFLSYFLPQLLAANYTRKSPYRKPWVVQSGIAQRLQILLLAIIVGLLGGSHATLALGLFFVVFTTNQVIAGLAAPSWFDLVARTTSPDRMGRLFGLRTSFGAALGFFNSLVLTLLLSYLAFPKNYSIALLIAFIYQLGSWLMIRRVEEFAPAAVEPPVPLMDLIIRVRSILSTDPVFRKFLGACALSTIGLIPMGFFTVTALSRFSLPETYVGFFTITVFVSQVAFAGLLGYAGDRKGHKLTLLICSVSMVGASLVGYVTPHPIGFFLVFSLVGLITGVEMLARYNFASECAREATRPLYIGIMNAWLAPFYLASLVAGWLSDRFGYDIVYGIGGVFAVAGLVLLARVPDPRSESR